MLRRAMDLVELVALQGEMSLRDIGEAMRLPKSTAHRLVRSLVEVRLLEAHRVSGGDAFALGGLVKELGGGHLSWRPLVQYVRPELAAIRDETGETAGLHVLYAGRRVLVDQVVSNHEHRWVYGNHMVPMPLYAGASAKMLLAMLPENEMHDLAKRALQSAAAKGRGTGALQDLLDKVAAIRSDGYSMSSEEVNPGIRSIAVPVVEDARDGFPLAVISLAAPTARLTENAMDANLKKMRAAARRISARLKEAAGKSG